LIKIGLRARILLFFVAIALGAVAALTAGLWFGYHRGGSPEMLGALMQGAIAAGFLILALVAWIWFLFDTHIARPIDKVASAMRARAHAEVSQELRTEDARYLGDLAGAASATAATLASTRAGLTEAVQRETARLSSDKGKLEQLLADVPPAVLLCTGRHHLVFYNGVARQLLAGSEHPVCLDRNVFDYLSEGPIRDAHHRLMEAADTDAVVDFLCLSPCGKRRLAGRMRLASDNEGDRGAYVMTLRDVTAEVAAYARRDALLADVFTRIRPALADLRRPVDADGSEAPREDIGAPVRVIEEILDNLEVRFESCRADGWPMAPANARELARHVQRDLEARGLTITIRADDVTLKCNTFDIVSLFGFLALKASEEFEADVFDFEITEQGDAARIELSWNGQEMGSEQLSSWLKLPVYDGGATCETLLKTHGSMAIPVSVTGRSGIAANIGPVVKSDPGGADLTRNVVYDFDLLSRLHYDRISDARLDSLTYVVFDTETTGLLPEQGDEIVQIAAVRVVNGKRVKKEVFDLLVNPGRSIPPSATAIHGVSNAMVADAVDVAEAIRQFYRFAEGAVLVAHNAPFDMEFLHRREREVGLRFVNPVLDTVLLSATVFGQGETHTLDALAERLGVTIEESARHTALGDAIATADVFIKLKDMLVGQGISRFGDVLAQTRRHGRLLRDLNDTAHAS
jgi:DNA polymerase-3 subunit epsilon